MPGDTVNMTNDPTILVIDDDPIVHKLLRAMLAQQGYAVVDAYRGEEGFELAGQTRPDLILLDIMMPEMDGFETIALFKQDVRSQEIPIIFLSAKANTSDKVRGLELGAADFVNKPFERAELLARIKTQIKLRRQEEALREYSQNLEQMVEERTKLLLHANRLASLGTLSAGIAHEINNPTTFITGNIQTIEQLWGTISPLLESHPEVLGNARLKFILDEFPSMIQSIRTGANRISNIVDGLKKFSRRETAVKSETEIDECLEEALKLTNNRLKYNIKVEKSLERDLPTVWASSQQLIQVFVNLLVNTADAIGSQNGHIRISGRSLPEERKVELSFEDDGPGIREDIQQKIFDPFFTTKPLGEGTGLGLSISHGIITDHGGTITVKSHPPEGTTFIITLPTEGRS